MATMMRANMASARVARRSTVVVRAEAVDRRSLFAGALVSAAALLVPKAEAIVIPSQESTGGLGVGKGSMVKSATLASSEGYTLEGYPGTRKPSFIEPSKKAALLKKARAQAQKASK